jgi:hypothetical protein
MTVEERFIRDLGRQYEQFVPCQRRVTGQMGRAHPGGSNTGRGPCAVALSQEIESEPQTGESGRIWSWQRGGGVPGWQDTLQIFERHHGRHVQPGCGEQATRRAGEHR